MPTLQPGDEAATATRSTDGETIDVADGGFPAIPGREVTITVDGDTNSINGVTADDPGAATVTTRLEYSTDGGSGWSLFSSNVLVEFVTEINGGGPTNGTGWTSQSVAENVGDIADLSLIQLRARTTVSLTGGASAGSGTSTLSGWEISYISAPSAIMEA